MAPKCNIIDQLGYNLGFGFYWLRTCKCVKMQGLLTDGKFWKGWWKIWCKEPKKKKKMCIRKGMLYIFGWRGKYMDLNSCPKYINAIQNCKIIIIIYTFHGFDLYGFACIPTLHMWFCRVRAAICTLWCFSSAFLSLCFESTITAADLQI